MPWLADTTRHDEVRWGPGEILFKTFAECRRAIEICQSILGSRNVNFWGQKGKGPKCTWAKHQRRQQLQLLRRRLQLQRQRQTTMANGKRNRQHFKCYSLTSTGNSNNVPTQTHVLIGTYCIWVCGGCVCVWCVCWASVCVRCVCVSNFNACQQCRQGKKCNGNGNDNNSPRTCRKQHSNFQMHAYKWLADWYPAEEQGIVGFLDQKVYQIG